MARSKDGKCDRCDRRISDLPVPIVFYMVIGVPGEIIENRFLEDDLPPLVEAMRELPESRVEYCVECVGAVVSVSVEEIARLAQSAAVLHARNNNVRRVQQVEQRTPHIKALARDHAHRQLAKTAKSLGVPLSIPAASTTE